MDSCYFPVSSWGQSLENWKVLTECSVVCVCGQDSVLSCTNLLCLLLLSMSSSKSTPDLHGPGYVLVMDTAFFNSPAVYCPHRSMDDMD